MTSTAVIRQLRPEFKLPFELPIQILIASRATSKLTRSKCELGEMKNAKGTSARAFMHLKVCVIL